MSVFVGLPTMLHKEVILWGSQQIDRLRWPFMGNQNMIFIIIVPMGTFKKISAYGHIKKNQFP
jgi:hypothetical protein